MNRSTAVIAIVAVSLFAFASPAFADAKKFKEFRDTINDPKRTCGEALIDSICLACGDESFECIDIMDMVMDMDKEECENYRAEIVKMVEDVWKDRKEHKKEDQDAYYEGYFEGLCE